MSLFFPIFQIPFELIRNFTGEVNPSGNVQTVEHQKREERHDLSVMPPYDSQIISLQGCIFTDLFFL